MSDVTVHIDESLNERSFQALGEDIAQQGGVQHVNFSHKHLHLMVIRYDHKRLDSQGILAVFTNHGLHAELIGF